MGILAKDMPVSILPLANNPERSRHQGRLTGIDQRFVTLRTAGNLGLAGGLKVLVEFRMERNEFKFESKLVQDSAPDVVVLERPSVIRRTRIREAPRISYPCDFQYNLWPRQERYEARLLDISELGLRIVSPFGPQKGSVLSLAFFLKEPQIRVICQAQVTWCRTVRTAEEDDEPRYEIGLRFTTLSGEIQYKIGRFVYERIVEQTEA